MARPVSSRRTLVVLAAVAGGVGLLLVAVIAFALLWRSAPAGDPGSTRVQAVAPRSDKEGVEWSHKELVEYLNSRGAGVARQQTITGFLFGPAVYLYPSHPPVEKPTDERLREMGAVYCQKRKTPQEAKDAAGAMDGPSFAWGTFLFTSTDAAYLEVIRSHLER